MLSIMISLYEVFMRSMIIKCIISMTIKFMISMMINIYKKWFGFVLLGFDLL